MLGLDHVAVGLGLLVVWQILDRCLALVQAGVRLAQVASDGAELDTAALYVFR
ncbi:hypothetical protein D3C72_2411600 [compost metagenome]